MRASKDKDAGPSWAEMLHELQARRHASLAPRPSIVSALPSPLTRSLQGLHSAGVDSLRRGADDSSVLEAYNALSQEQRDELLARGVDRLRQEPLILRLAETPAEAHELLLKIAPELEGVPGSGSPFDVTQLLRGACTC